MRATDVAGNTDASPASSTWLVDTTAPTSTATFPVASASYTAAEWAAGCATAGLCGTYGDGSGSGVASVEVSIRRGTGNYWNGSGFSSGTEVWNTATLAGGNWSFAFAAGNFPADGNYTVRVRATDAVANVETPSSRTFEVDQTSPSSTVAFPAAAGTYNAAGWAAGCATAGLCGTYTDATSGVASVEVSIRRGTGNYWNGSGFSSASEVWNTATLAGGNWSYAFAAGSFPADGAYTVRVRANDVAGNTEAPSSRTFTYDTTAPQTTIDSSPSNPSGSNGAAFDVSSSEGGSTFECRIDGGSWSACTSPKSYAGLAGASHTFDVRATDVAGNTDGTPASYTWLVDTTAPSSTTSFPVASESYTAAEWAAGCATAGLCGTYSDGSGAGVASVEVSIRRGTGNYWNGTGFSSAFEVWNTATLAGGNWSYAFAAVSFPADGNYTVRVRTTDAVANVETPSSRTFTIDRDDPQTTIDSNPADPTSSTSADFDFSSDEGGSTFECRIDGGAWGPCTSPKSYAGLTDGSHTFQVRATDIAGNVDASPASSTWLVDTTAPFSALAFPAPAGSYTAAEWDTGCATAGLCGTYGDGSGSGVADVEVSIQQGGGDYWDGSGFSSSTEVWNEADLVVGDWSYDFDSSDLPADGDYTVRVRARDDVGNTEAPSSRTFEVDQTDPSSALVFPAAAAIYNPAGWNAGCPAPGLCGTYFDGTSGVAQVEISIQYDGGDYWDGSGFSSSIEVWNDADLAAGAWSYDFDASNLPVDGEYAVRVRARDGAGNTETPSSRTFTFDASEPETAIDSSMADPTNSTSATFDFSADEPGATFECALDGGAWSACTSPKAYTGLTDGGHTFEVRATDPAGNTDGNPAAFNWTIDTVDPTSTATFPAAGSYTSTEWDVGCSPVGLCGTYSDTGTGVVDVEVSIRRGSGNYWDGSGFGSATEVWNDATFAGGDWTLRLRGVRLPGRRLLHGAAARARRRGQHRDALEPDVRVRRHGAVLDDRLPRRRGHVQHRRLGGGLRHRRALRHLRGRAPPASPRSRSPSAAAPATTGTAPPSRAPPRSGTTPTLAAGDWSYGFDSADFPADGNYTVRVRATDVAGNTESASSRTFTYDTTAPQTTIDSSPTDPTSSHGRHLRLLVERGRLHLRVPPRRRRLERLHQPEELHQPDRRQPHLRRARHRPGREHGCLPRLLHLARRHDRPLLDRRPSPPRAASTTRPAGTPAARRAASAAPTATAPAPASPRSRSPSAAAPATTGTAPASRARPRSGTTPPSPPAPGRTTSTPPTSPPTATTPCASARPTTSATSRRRRAAPSSTTRPTRARSSPSPPPAASTARPAGTPAAPPSASAALSPTRAPASPTVEVSVQRVSDDLYWDGDSFDAGAESWFSGDSSPAATGRTPSRRRTSRPTAQYVVHVRATDDAGNTEAGPSRTFRIDNTDPSALVTFPAAGTRYSTAGWNAGCATSGLCGTQSDSGSGVAQVEVSLKRVSTDLYWDGDSFDAGGETYFTATLAGGNWSYAFPAGNFPADGGYTLHVRATDDAGNTEGGPTRTFTYDTTPPQTTIDSSPADPTASTSGELRLLLERRQLHVRVPHRRRRLERLHQPEELHEPDRRQPHLRRARHRRRRATRTARPATYTWLVDTARRPRRSASRRRAASTTSPAGTPAAPRAGSAAPTRDGSGSGVDQVRVSVRRVSTGLYWNGASFSSASEVLLNTGLAGGNWTRAFPASNFPADGDYSVSVFATDEVGNAETPSTLTFHFDATDPTGLPDSSRRRRGPARQLRHGLLRLGRRRLRRRLGRVPAPARRRRRLDDDRHRHERPLLRQLGHHLTRRRRLRPPRRHHRRRRKHLHLHPAHRHRRQHAPRARRPSTRCRARSGTARS